jgi:hypothetical protein
VDRAVLQAAQKGKLHLPPLQPLDRAQEKCMFKTMERMY